jgi:hypothetical protein
MSNIHELSLQYDFKKTFNQDSSINESWNMEYKVLNVKDCGSYEIREQDICLNDNPMTRVKDWCYNKSGKFIGTEKEMKFFLKKGITDFDISGNGDSVCSIGFNPKEQKWYGWSHRAICGYGIGDKVFEDSFGNGDTLFTQHGKVTITNLNQAKQSAKNFANYVN